MELSTTELDPRLSVYTEYMQEPLLIMFVATIPLMLIKQFFGQAREKQICHFLLKTNKQKRCVFLFSKSLSHKILGTGRAFRRSIIT